MDGWEGGKDERGAEEGNSWSENSAWTIYFHLKGNNITFTFMRHLGITHKCMFKYVFMSSV